MPVLCRRRFFVASEIARVTNIMIIQSYLARIIAFVIVTDSFTGSIYIQPKSGRYLGIIYRAIIIIIVGMLAEKATFNIALGLITSKYINFINCSLS
jgi:hypothetical protein